MSRHADIIDYKIHGDNMQVLEVELDPGEAVMGEPGAMVFMTDQVRMNVGTGGGLLSGLKRKLTGDSFFVSNFEHTGNHGKQHVGFAAAYPGRIIPINLHEFQGQFICQRRSFLACANGVEISVFLNRKIGAGLFGGQGFILQKLQGVGMAFIHAGGNMVTKTLQPGETLRVDTGCVLGFTATMSYSIDYVGGFLNPVFGREGVFLTTLTGPGTAIIQSIPFQRVVDAISAAQEDSK